MTGENESHAVGSAQDEVPPHEVRVAAAKRATTPERLRVAVVLAGVAALAIYAPWRFGVVLVPVIFAWIGYQFVPGYVPIP